MHQTPEHLKQTVGKALGRLPSGVYILTAQVENQPFAMMASWVQQAAFHPPTVSVAISRERPIAAGLKEGGRFGISVLAEGDSHLMRKYARGIEPGCNPFEGVNIRTLENGVIILADALAYLECKVSQIAHFGADHDLFISEVTGGELLREGSSFIHLRGNGFHY